MGQCYTSRLTDSSYTGNLTVWQNGSFLTLEERRCATSLLVKKIIVSLTLKVVKSKLITN